MKKILEKGNKTAIRWVFSQENVQKPQTSEMCSGTSGAKRGGKKKKKVKSGFWGPKKQKEGFKKAVGPKLFPTRGHPGFGERNGKMARRLNATKGRRNRNRGLHSKAKKVRRVFTRWGGSGVMVTYTRGWQGKKGGVGKEPTRRNLGRKGKTLGSQQIKEKVGSGVGGRGGFGGVPKPDDLGKRKNPAF